MKRRSLLRSQIVPSLSTIIVFLMFSCVAFAQQGTATVRGTVSDPQDRPVASATVSLISVETNLTRTQNTSDEGGYVFTAVVPGLYRLEVEGSGFKKTSVTDVKASVNTPIDINVRLEIGTVTETVNVTTSSESALNTQDASQGNNFDEAQIKRLPLEARGVVGLLSLQPGVVFTGIANDARSGAVNGGRSDQANVTLDGVDVNDQQTSAAFTSVLRITTASVQEFRVTTANPNANQGRSSGAQISLVTKSGTNSFHGSLYESHRNTVTTANDFFNKAVLNGPAIPRTPLLRNIFGGTIGGPIKKNRLFFFFNYEGRRDRSATNETRIIPTETMKAGILRFMATDGSIRSLSPTDLKAIDPRGIGVNSAILDLFKNYPTGNDPNQGLDLGLNFIGFRFNAPFFLNFNTYTARFDYRLTSDGNHSLFWRGILQDDNQTGAAPQFPGQEPASTFLENSRGFVVGYNAVLSSRMTNNFTWGLTRQGTENTGVSGPAFTIRSFDDTQNFVSRAFGRKVPVHNFVDDITWVSGNHTIQTGANIRFIRNDRFTFVNSFPAFAINDGWMSALGRDILPAVAARAGIGFANSQRNAIVRALMALYGTTPQISANFLFDRDGKALPVGSSQAREFAANEYEVFGQDSWRVRPNLTLTLGLRYGYATPPWETSGLQVTPTANIHEFIEQRVNAMASGIPNNQLPLLAFDLAGKANGRQSYFPPDRNNFAPRVAFAYSPNFDSSFLKTIFGGPGKSSIRGGFSTAYNHLGGAFVVTSDLSGAFGLSTPRINQSGVLDYSTAPRFTGLGSLPALPFSIPTGGFPTVASADTSNLGFVIDNTLKTPYVLQYNLSWQRDLGHRLTVEASYVATLGRKLLAKADISAPLIHFRDPASGQTFTQAVQALQPFIRNGTPASGVPNQPFFQNIMTNLATSTLNATQRAYNILVANAPSWTDALFSMDVVSGGSRFGRNTFFQQQFQSLPAWTNMGSSSFHGANIILRKRFSGSAQFDFNYTFSKAIDNGSAVENSARLGGQIADIFNPRGNFGPSDFDAKHNFNANGIAELPFGRGKRFGGSVSGWQDQIIGGWDLAGIFRYRTGLPTGVGNGFFFPTNFFVTPPATRIAPVQSSPGHDPTGRVNLFSDPAAAFAAFDRTDIGSSGSRNVLRGPRFFTIDLGVHKKFRLPWEGHKLELRWETFNLTNTPNFNGFSLTLDNKDAFGRFTSTTGDTGRRVMQFSLSYDF